MRAPFSLEKTAYDAARGVVIYRSKPQARRGSRTPGYRGAGAEFLSQAPRAAKAAWAKLIRKVYEVDPLECPKCSAQDARHRSSKTRP